MIEQTQSLFGSEMHYRWPREDGALALDGELAGQLVTAYADRSHFLVPVSTRPDLHMYDPNEEIEPSVELTVPTQEYRTEQIAARDHDGNTYVVPVLAVGPLGLLEQHLKLFEFLIVSWRAWWLGRI